MAGKLNTPFVDGKIKGMTGGGSDSKAPMTKSGGKKMGGKMAGGKMSGGKC